MILNLKNMKALASCFLLGGLLALSAPAFAQPKTAPKDAKTADASKPVDSDGDGVADDKDGCPKQKGDSTCLGCPCKPTAIELVKLPEYVAPAPAPDPNKAAPKKGKGKGKGKRAEAAAAEPTFDETFIKTLNEIVAMAPDKFTAQQAAPIGKVIPATQWEANVALPQQGRAIINSKTTPNPSFQAYFCENAKVSQADGEVTYERLKNMLAEAYKDWTIEDKPSNKRILHWIIFKSPSNVEIAIKMQNTVYGSKSDPSKFDISVSVMQGNAPGSAPAAPAPPKK